MQTSSARAQPHQEMPNVNPFRSLNRAAFDRGAKINRRAGELQLLAAVGLTEENATTALGTALGRQVAAIVRRNTGSSIEETLELVSQAIRAQAYIAAGLAPGADDAENTKKLTVEEFNRLVARLVRTAAINTLPDDAICTAAKALGVLISLSAPRLNCAPEQLLNFGQKAVVRFAAEATRDLDKTAAMFGPAGAVSQFLPPKEITKISA
jgi:hypothetical protein